MYEIYHQFYDIIQLTILCICIHTTNLNYYRYIWICMCCIFVIVNIHVCCWYYIVCPLIWKLSIKYKYININNKNAEIFNIWWYFYNTSNIKNNNKKRTNDHPSYTQNIPFMVVFVEFPLMFYLCVGATTCLDANNVDRKT